MSLPQFHWRILIRLTEELLQITYGQTSAALTLVRQLPNGSMLNLERHVTRLRDLLWLLPNSMHRHSLFLHALIVTARLFLHLPVLIVLVK